MKQSNNSIDKFLSIIPGGLFGLLSCAIVLFCDFISIFLFHKEYSFLNNMISELGRGSYGFVFSMGLIISGIISVPYYLALGRTFNEDTVNKKLKKLAIIVSLISIITFVFVGVFPSLEENYIIYFTHGTFAFISLATGMIYLIIFSYLMLKDEKYSKIQVYHGFIVAGAYIIFLFTWIPIIEWIITFGLISWITSNSVFMIHKKIPKIELY